MDTLDGQRISLRPLQFSDAAARLNAAQDGELWNLTVTVRSYLEKKLAGYGPR